MTIPSTKMLLLSFALLFGAACPSDGALDSISKFDMDSDLAGEDMSLQPQCLAGRGIAGTLLKEQQQPGKFFCVDFDQSGLTDQMLTDAGWNLAAASSGCGGFTVTEGRLTIKAPLARPTPKCDAEMPALVVGSDTKKVYVSIVHDLPLAELTQFAFVSSSTADTQIAGWTGKSTKAPPSGILQFASEGPVFAGVLRAQNTSTSAGSQLPVWSIQSIAVFGAP